MKKKVATGRPPRKRKRRPNPHLVKIHHSYTIEEAATVCNVHKNTFRTWFQAGLTKVDSKRPYLIHGGTLKEFLETRFASRKRPCKPGQLYCLRCRAPKYPGGNVAEYKPITATLGSLFALCPDCTAPMNRRMNPLQLDKIPAEIEITRQLAQSRISKSDEPSLNSDFKQGESNHA